MSGGLTLDVGVSQKEGQFADSAAPKRRDRGTPFQGDQRGQASLVSDESQAFDGLAGDIGDQFIVLVEMEDRELCELGGRSVQ